MEKLLLGAYCVSKKIIELHSLNWLKKSKRKAVLMMLRNLSYF